jgi:uncharacterized repeat protein (TIGR01451 family)
MKTIKTHCFAWAALFIISILNSHAQSSTHFPDDNFHNYLKTIYPECIGADGKIDPTCSRIKNEYMLSAGANNISNLKGIEYFENVNILYISYNKLTTIPTLPVSVRYLYLLENKLTSLPDLPPNLVELIVSGNQLTSLPTLPATLDFLGAYSNNLTSLPALPPLLRDLTVTDNNLTSLPALPSNLKSIQADRNRLTSLPDLPPNLVYLSCGFNNISCLPSLPESLETLAADFSEDRITCVPNKPSKLSLGSIPLCSPVVSPCPIQPTVTGAVYIDANRNGIKDANEQGIPDIRVKIMPEDRVVLTDRFGYYRFTTRTYGNYSISLETPMPFHTSTPAAQNVALTGTGIILHDKHLALSTTSTVKDLAIGIEDPVRIRAGRSTIYNINYSNQGAQVAESGQVVFTFDPGAQAYVYTWPADYTTEPGKITLNYTRLIPGESRLVTIDVVPPTTAQIGDVYTVMAGIAQAGDATPGNNAASISNTITGSFDPNDISVTPEGNITIDKINAQEPLTYTINFQNEGNDVAEDIKVTNAISSSLDISTLETISTTHPAVYSNVGGVATWTFTGINLDYKSHNEPLSKGFIRFRIKPKKFLPYDTKITSKADIIFDFNPAVATNTVVNTVVPCSLTTASFPSNLCTGTSFAVSYTVQPCATFSASNIFRVQLSDANGNFNAPVNIGSLTSNTNGTITATIPSGTPIGSLYKIRITSTDPVTSYTAPAGVTISSNCGTLGFDGNDRVVIPDNAVYNLGTGNFTIESWVNVPSTFNPALPAVILTKKATGSTGHIALYVTKTNLKLDINNSILTSETVNIFDGICHHIAVTRSGTDVRFYVDGLLKGTVTNNGAINSTNTWNVGYEGTTASALIGNIDEIRIWKAAKSAAEIAAGKSVIVNATATDLVGYWDFNEGSGEVVYDRSSYNSNGSLGSSPTTADDANPTRSTNNCYAPAPQTALTFDGTNDKVTLPAHSGYNLGTNPFLIEAWIKPGTTPVFKSPVISKRASGNYNGYMLYLYSNGTNLLFQMNGINYISVAFPTLFDNNCHHIAVMRAVNGDINFYLDGNSIGYVQAGLRNLTTSGPLFIGYDEYDNISFKGTINQVRIWNTTRYNFEILRDLSVTVNPTTTNLIAQYTFKEPGGQSVLDFSPLSNTGYLGSNNVQSDGSDPVRTNFSCFTTDRIVFDETPHSNAMPDTISGGPSVQVFPNPFTEMTEVVIPGAGNEMVDILLTDLSGKIVWREKVAANTPNSVGGNLPAGTYMLHIAGSEKTGKQMLIKIE